MTLAETVYPLFDIGINCISLTTFGSVHGLLAGQELSSPPILFAKSVYPEFLSAQKSGGTGAFGPTKRSACHTVHFVIVALNDFDSPGATCFISWLNSFCVSINC